MRDPKLKNIPASTRQKLLNLARDRNDDFGLILTKYGLERILFRLSKSKYREVFILKGALLFELWTAQRYRPTRDADFLANGDNSPERFVEYADVLGIPFDFTAKPVIAPPQPPRETIQVKAVRPERDALEITFPRVAGYRVELPAERLSAEFNADSVLELTPDLVGPSITRNSGIIGEEVDLSLEHLGDMRRSTLIFHVAKRLLYTKWRDPGEEPKEPKLHLFVTVHHRCNLQTNTKRKVRLKGGRGNPYN